MFVGLTSFLMVEMSVSLAFTVQIDTCTVEVAVGQIFIRKLKAPDGKLVLDQSLAN